MKTLGILGKKLGMTQIFDEMGVRVPVTVIEAGPCAVLQVKTVSAGELEGEPPRCPRRQPVRDAQGNILVENDRPVLKEMPQPRRSDGYYAVQLGFGNKKPTRATKPESGHARKAGFGPQCFLREFRLDDKPQVKLGDTVNVSVLEGVELVDITGISKGKGFQGGMKRWHFKGQRASHGCSKRHRHPGALGRQCSISKGVPKGKRMAGHLGAERVTSRTHRVVEINPEKNLLVVKGPVPGANGGYLVIRRSLKAPSSRG